MIATFYKSDLTVDGYVERVINESEYDKHTKAGNGAANTPGSEKCIQIDDGATKNYIYRLKRSFFLFDTSILNSGANITSAIFSIYVTATHVDHTQAANSHKIKIVQSNLISNTNIENADYEGNESFQTALSDTITDINSLNLNAYNDFPLNAAGLANISKTGITKLGTKGVWDNPGNYIYEADTKTDYVTINFSGSVSNKPKLVVNYEYSNLLGMDI